jgi:amino acid transporter
VSRIYATPGQVLRFSGSVGVSFIMWSLGAIIAACGTTVYVELGTGIPRSGGEKNYLEYIYTRPKFLVSCAYIGYTLIMVRTLQLRLLFLIINGLKGHCNSK